jgi:putative transposase
MPTWYSLPSGAGRFSARSIFKRLKEIFQSVCDHFEVVLKEFNGEPDHEHLLVSYPPKVRLSELVSGLKGASSRRMKQEFLAISMSWSVRRSKGHLWSPSYVVGSPQAPRSQF